MVQRTVKNADELALLTCRISGCGKSVFARGWCSAHWSRWRRHGDPLLGGTATGAPAQFLNDVVLAYAGTECLKWPFAVSNHGYGIIRSNGKMRSVSRVVCESVYGPAPTIDHEAAHSCGKGHEGCCSPIHLRWATHSENLMDRLEHGTINRGERHGLAKLTADKVAKIRANPSVPLSKFADRYGVSKSCVDLARRRITWHWID